MVIRSGGGWAGDESIRDRTGQERPANTLISTRGVASLYFAILSVVAAFDQNDWASAPITIITMRLLMMI